MPFGFDMQQVFNFIMQKSIMDMKFGNNMFGMGNLGGGNYMNSCFGSGFSNLNYLDNYNFNLGSANVDSNSDSSAKSPEEKAENRIFKEKHNDLYKILDDYCKNEKDLGKEAKILLEEQLKDYKNPTEDNYKELKSLYEKHKAGIDKDLKVDLKISKVQQKFVAQVVDGEKLKDCAKLLDGENLKPEIDVMEFLTGLGSFASRHKATVTKDNANLLRRLNNALFAALKEKANEVLKEDGISEETKTEISNLTQKSLSASGRDDVDKLFAYINIAKAEVVDNKLGIIADALDLEETPKNVETTTSYLKSRKFIS